MAKKKKKPMSRRQLLYLEEYEKYKHIEVGPGLHETTQGIQVEILSIDLGSQTALVKTCSSDFERGRTLHWCRKNLTLIKG